MNPRFVTVGWIVLCALWFVMGLLWGKGLC